MIDRRDFLLVSAVEVLLLAMLLVLVFALRDANRRSEVLLRQTLDTRHEEVLESFQKTEEFLRKVDERLSELHDL